MPRRRFTWKLAVQLAWVRKMRRGAPDVPEVSVSTTGTAPATGAG